MPDYKVHKAVELSKVKVKRRAELSAPGYLENNYIAQPKYDGCQLMAYLCEANDGSRWVSFESRTGEAVKSCDHIAVALLTFPDMPTGLYLGECWSPDLPFNEISGLFRRQESSEETCRLQFAIFDYLTDEEWIAGESRVGYADRVARMNPNLGRISQGSSPIWLAGSFGTIASTWPNGTAQQVCNELVAAGGYDGLILRDPSGHYFMGDRGTGGEIIKVKAKVSYALRVTGWTEGTGKHKGRMGALIVDFNGSSLQVGTGFTDAERSRPTDFLNRIIEVEAMGLSSDGLLREPRYKGIRSDVTEPDA